MAHDELIRVYKREELEHYLTSSMSPFSTEQIEKELERRDDLMWKKNNDPRYPDLRHS